MPKTHIVLASASPRRKELLAVLGLSPAIRPVEIDETVHAGEAPAEYVARLARDKAVAAPAAGREVVIAADTAVVLGTEIFGKPASAEDFRRMMEGLSGRWHEVYTAVALRRGAETSMRVSISRVRLRRIGTAEIDRYWKSGEPADKAGGYAIQGLGSVLVAELRGSYSGVVGLPLFETAELLAGAGVDVLSVAAVAHEE